MRCVLLAALLVLGGAAAVPIHEDPAGDVEWSAYENSAPAQGDWKAVDLRWLTIEEQPEVIVFTVGVEGFPTCEGGQCANAGDLRTYFQYGEEGYYVQQGIHPLGYAYGRLNTVPPGQVDGQNIGGEMKATKDIANNAIIVEIPRGLLVDESGTPPLKDRTLTNIITRSYSQWSFGGPEMGGSSDMFVTRDQMGFDAPQSFTFRLGGSTTSGLMGLDVAHPYRASNGGAALYEFEIQLTNTAGTSVDFIATAEDLPRDWSFEAPKTITVPAGSNATFSVLVETLSGHQHGGTESFTLLVEDSRDLDTWGRVELGVHYVTVPQPAGHHPTLFLHTLTDGNVATAATFFGNDDGRIWMNALEEDPGDEGVPVVAQGGAQGTAAQEARWSICLIPNLRLGIDMELERLGEMELRLGAQSPTLGVTVTGRLIHIAGPEPLHFCDPSLWRDRETMTIATIEASNSADLTGNVQTFTSVVSPTSDGDYIRYQEGAQLVLELTASYTGGSPGPTGLSMHPGGRITLPLNEYRDERPPGFVGGSSQVVQGGNVTTPEPAAQVEEAPAMWLLLPLLVAFWLRRR